MKRRLLKTTLLLVTIAMVVGLAVYWLNREPRYQGRKLSEWAADARSDKGEEQKKAKEALIAMGDQAVPHLAGSLVKGETLLEKINRKVGDKLPAKYRKHAVKLFGVRETIERKREALRALQLMGTNAQQAVPELGIILRDPNVLLSSMAGIALGEMGPAAVPVLVPALDEGDYNVRATACAALQRLGTNALPAAPRLVEYLVNESGPILGVASYTLARIGPGAFPALERAFTHTNANARRWAVYAVGFMTPSPEDVSVLYPLTREKNPQVRLAAVEALARVYPGSEQVATVLRERFDDEDVAVRTAAIQGFATSPWRVIPHMDACMEMLEDESPKVRGFAAEALMNVSPLSKRAVPQLEKLATDEDEFAREKALLALRTLTGEER